MNRFYQTGLGNRQKNLLYSKLAESTGGLYHEANRNLTGHLLRGPVFPDGGAAGHLRHGRGMRHLAHRRTVHAHHVSRLYLPGLIGPNCTHRPPLDRAGHFLRRHLHRLSGHGGAMQPSAGLLPPFPHGVQLGFCGSRHGGQREAIPRLRPRFSRGHGRSLPGRGHYRTQHHGGLPAHRNGVSGGALPTVYYGFAKKTSFLGLRPGASYRRESGARETGCHGHEPGRRDLLLLHPMAPPILSRHWGPVRLRLRRRSDERAVSGRGRSHCSRLCGRMYRCHGGQSQSALVWGGI